MKCRAPLWFFLGIVAGCSHADAFAYVAPDVGPSSTGSDVVLTQNAINYWPTLTADGTGVLYSYIDETEATVRPITQFESPPYVVGGLHIHRCMGEIPVGGGTRHWEFCDNRPDEIDSLTSFTAYAMGTDGRLIYSESITPRRFPFDTARVSLWLADSATPFRRTLLAKFPKIIGDSIVNWIADLQWTGPKSFLAIGQRAVLLPAGSSSAVDSVFYGQSILRGTIADGIATLNVVPGTIGATAYAVTDSGTSIVIAQLDRTDLMKVPMAGGASSVIAVGVAAVGSQVVGLSCRGTRCVAAVGAGGAGQLRSVNLVTGAVATVLSTVKPISMPVLTSSGDVIAQVGPGLGRIRTSGTAFNPSSPSLTLHLYKNLVP